MLVPLPFPTPAVVTRHRAPRDSLYKDLTSLEGEDEITRALDPFLDQMETAS